MLYETCLLFHRPLSMSFYLVFSTQAGKDHLLISLMSMSLLTLCFQKILSDFPLQMKLINIPSLFPKYQSKQRTSLLKLMMSRCVGPFVPTGREVRDSLPRPEWRKSRRDCGPSSCRHCCSTPAPRSPRGRTRCASSRVSRLWSSSQQLQRCRLRKSQES